MSRFGRRYKVAATATLVLVIAAMVAAVYAAWQVAALAVTLLVALSIIVSLESRVVQKTQLSVLRDIQRSVIDLRSSVEKNEAANKRMREAISSAQLAMSEQDARRHEALLRDIQRTRKLDGERHARTRNALAGLAGIETVIRDQAANLLTGSQEKERRFLGILESERVRMHDRHQEVMRLLGRSRRHEGEDASA